MDNQSKSKSSAIVTDSDANKTITEEESSSVDENHDAQVAKFLQDLDSDRGVSQGVIRDKSGTLPSPRNEDISTKIKFLGLEAGPRNGHQHVMSANLISMQPSVMNVNGNGASKLSDHGAAASILDDLGIEKLIAEEHL